MKKGQQIFFTSNFMYGGCYTILSLLHKPLYKINCKECSLRRRRTQPGYTIKSEARKKQYMTVIIFHVEIMSKVTIHTEVHVFSCITVSYSYFFIGFQVVSKLMLVCVTFTNCMQVRYFSCVIFSPDMCCLALAKCSTQEPCKLPVL